MEDSCIQQRGVGFVMEDASVKGEMITVPEDAKAAASAAGETTEAELLASLKVSEDESKVLHDESIPRPEQMSALNSERFFFKTDTIATIL